MNTYRTLRCLAPILLLLGLLRAEDATKPAATTTPVPAGPLQRLDHSDPVGGYSVTLPPGYVPLTADETHAIFEGLSEFWGKDVGERARKKPPVWFKGPIDPKNPKASPPMFAIAYNDLDQPVDASQITAYKEKIEDEYKRQGNKYGEIELKTLVVDGITSLQIEHDLISRINNERSRVLRIGVPAKGRWYDLSFNFGIDQTELVHAAVKDVIDSFKVMAHPEAPVQEEGKWMRVLYFTIGGGLVGLILSVVLKRLSVIK
jgi:hypothetical protein